MNKPPIPARAAKLLGVGILAVSLLTVTSGCAANSSKDAAPAASASTAAATPGTAQPTSLRGTLVNVISGDTVQLTPVSDKNGEPTGEPNVTVHILGIKAPAAGECGGPDATAELKRISAGGGFFRVTFDSQAARVDSRGNTQGYLAAGDGGTSMNLGPAMLQNGFAQAWYDTSDHEPKSYADYSKTAKTAQAQSKGIWAKCPAPKA